ncbi:uncharacterized protein LOC132737538 isoform X2 [Ruditapes philippinarum]|uniref:uncharacterized protein LOC132737538 isoform X2 n=1 Tax=Ruditapes philippinarum TaxID=129788 RepID=UPI00295B88F6|nr:uncharacterized protein LOC132737538 isoform X2 [Ruditapes philippinarum]
MYVPVTLSFTTLAYPEPGPKGFLWHKEDGIDWIPLLSNSDLQISSSGLHSNITIFNVSLWDYGTYRLTVTNEVGIYKQMIRLIKKDSTQKELVKKSDTEGDAYNSWMIVGIVFGFLTIAIGFYATGITFLWKKAVSKGAREPTGESTAQTTYVNTDVAAQHVEVNSTQDQHITEAESVNLYTDLAHYSKDDKSTYEVLKGN